MVVGNKCTVDARGVLAVSCVRRRWAVFFTTRIILNGSFSNVFAGYFCNFYESRWRW
jgi:hypothetical protein